MSRSSFLKKVSSPVLSAGLGAAVCLSNGGAANAVTGNISASNGGNTVFNVGALYAFGPGPNVAWILNGSPLSFISGGGYADLNFSGANILFHGPGVAISSGMPGGFAKNKDVVPSQSDKYIAVKFNFAIKYGWLHVVSTNGTGTQITIDKWGYNPTGAKINTLADSLSTKTLALSGGQAQLHWNNKNEQGVARYVVQAKNAVGEWAEVDSDTPGAGRYAATVAAGDYRLVVENVDGTTEELSF